MNEVQLVIFDCDGVLVDSERISNRVLAEMLTAEGLPTSLEDALVEYKGLLLSDTVARAERTLGHPLPDGWLAEYECDRTEAFRRELEPIPGGRCCGAADRGRRNTQALNSVRVLTAAI